MQPKYKWQPFLLRNNKMNPSSNRYSKAVFILITLILLWTPEAYVSEVVFEDNGTRTEEDLRKLSAESSLIVILHDTQELEKIKEVTFPKETHYLQSQTTQYIEYAQIYKVKKVLKHTSPGSIEKRLKAGDTIRVLRKNEFSELDYKLSHEQGLRKSPLIPYKKPMFPQKNRECLLFLNAYEANIWHRTYGVRGGDEGIESEKIIIKILSNN